MLIPAAKANPSTQKEVNLSALHGLVSRELFREIKNVGCRNFYELNKAFAAGELDNLRHSDRYTAKTIKDYITQTTIWNG